jgi:hypothetical protein
VIRVLRYVPVALAIIGVIRKNRSAAAQKNSKASAKAARRSR